MNKQNHWQESDQANNQYENELSTEETIQARPQLPCRTQKTRGQGMHHQQFNLFNCFISVSGSGALGWPFRQKLNPQGLDPHPQAEKLIGANQLCIRGASAEH
jgi:hypothetical protein